MGVEDRTKKAIQGTALDPEAPHAPLPKGGQRKQQRTRRVPLLLVSRDQGLGVCERVGQRLAAVHGWDATALAQMLEEYKAEVALSRRWRQR